MNLFKNTVGPPQACGIALGYTYLVVVRTALVLVVLLLRKGNQNGSDIWILNVFGRSEAPLPLMLRPGNGRVEPTGSEEWDGFVAASLRGFEIEIGKHWGLGRARRERRSRETRLPVDRIGS